MKQSFLSFLLEFDTMCEIVYCDEEGTQLNEAAIRAFKRSGMIIKRYYRCTTGDKAGRLVSNPKSCSIRKSPDKVRHGRKVMRKKQNIINQKARIAKRSSLSKLVTKKNVIMSHVHKKRKK